METGPTETIGVMTVNKKLFGVTLEPGKKGNEKDISCIPAGVYQAEKYYSEKFDRVCLKLFDVHGRNCISMHNGNDYTDTAGCIIVGRYTGDLSGKRAIMQSKSALKDLISKIGNICTIIIREDF